MAAASDYSSIGHPVQVVRLATDKFWGDDEFALDTGELQAVVGRDEIQNMPVALVSIVGCHRTGKSFLLNYLVRYLFSQEKGNDSWLEDKESPLCGFSWRRGLDRCTDGIVMWNRPFILRKKSGQKVAVFVMDTQGLFDGSIKSSITSMIYALSATASSIQILNIMRTVDEAILKEFEVCTETAMIAYGLTFGCSKSDKFQQLIYLIRDWIDPAKYRFGEHGGHQYYQEVLQASQSRPWSLHVSGGNIEKYYGQIDCFLMPHPGENATVTSTPLSDDSDEQPDLSDCPFEGKISQLSSRFTKYLKKLGPFLLKPDDLHLKTIGERVITGKELSEIFKKCVFIFLSEEIPPPRNTRKILIGEFNSMVLMRTVERHEQELVSVFEKLKVGGKLPSTDQLENAIKEEEKRTRHRFNDTTRDPDEDIQPLFKKFENALAKIKSESILKLKKDITRQRDLEKHLDMK